MTGQKDKVLRESFPVPSQQPQVPRPKPPGTNAATVSSCSSSVTSLYLDDDPPFFIQPRTNTKLFLPFEDETSTLTATLDPVIELQQKQIAFWNRLVLSRSISLGPRHLRTAEALIDFGNAQFSAQEYLAAGRSYNSALKIFRAKYGDFHLSVARALDKLGLAISMTGTNVDSALNTLEVALKIRCELLGPCHVDSVDSLNNVASVHMNRGDFAIATRYYRMVIRYREQIFGRYHASVGVAAYALACILDDRLESSRDAQVYFKMARDINDALGLVSSPYYVDTCARLREKWKLLEI